MSEPIAELGWMNCTLIVEGKAELRAPGADELDAAIESLTPDGGPGFLIVDRDGSGFAQTAGGKGAYVVEWRDWNGDEASSPLFVAGRKNEGSGDAVAVPTNGAHVTVMSNERLNKDDAKLILQSFLRGEPRPDAYAWRDNSESIPRLGLADPDDHSQTRLADGWRDIEHVQMAAVAGNAEAQHVLGCRYRDGIEVPQDFVAALRWFKASSLQSYVPAICDAATMYRFGRGVKQDLVQAASFHVIAALEGDAIAMSHLADYREDLEKIALVGRQYAALCLAKIYKRGLGVEEDQAAMFAWLKWGQKDCAPDAIEDDRLELQEMYEFYDTLLDETDRARARKEYRQLKARSAKLAKGWPVVMRGTPAPDPRQHH